MDVFDTIYQCHKRQATSCRTSKKGIHLKRHDKRADEIWSMINQYRKGSIELHSVPKIKLSALFQSSQRQRYIEWVVHACSENLKRFRAVIGKNRNAWIRLKSHDYIISRLSKRYLYP